MGAALLLAASPCPGAPVLYGAHGEGPKPVLLGSVDKSRPADWRNQGGNLWTTGAPPTPDALPAPTTSALPWRLHT